MIYKQRIEPIIELDYCNLQILAFIKNEYSLPYDIKETIGRHNHKQCENCQNNLKRLENIFEEKLSGKIENETITPAFPNCCKRHKNLHKLDEFKLEDFKTVPKKTALKVILVNQHITNVIEENDWYKKTTHYIDYAIDSLGSFPENYGSAFLLLDVIQNIKTLIKTNIDVTTEKKDKILKYLDTKIDSDSISTWKKDISELKTIYTDWLNIFPFEFSLFQEIENKYKRTIPFFLSEKNIYSDRDRLLILSQEEMLKKLCELTDDIFKTIDLFDFKEKNDVLVVSELKKELKVAQAKFKQRKGYNYYDKKNKFKYRKALKNWFSDQKEIIEILIEQHKEIKKPKSVFTTEKGLKFKTDEDKQTLASRLKPYFANGQDIVFNSLINGEKTETRIHFRESQNKLAELFKRLKGEIILSNQAKIITFLCDNFTFDHENGNQKEVRDFNKSTLQSLFYSGTGEPPMKDRLFSDWIKPTIHEKK